MLKNKPVSKSISFTVGFTVLSRNPYYADLSESDLVSCCREGDEAAFNEVVWRLQWKIFSVANSILRNSHDAEDIRQIVLMKVYNAIKRFDGRSTLETWVHTIVVNETYDFFRRKKSRINIHYENEQVWGKNDLGKVMGETPDKSLSGDVVLERKEYLSQLISRLPLEDRQLLIRKEVLGFSIAELSKASGLNENTIKVKLFRTRQKLLNQAQQIQRVNFCRQQIVARAHAASG